MCLLESSGACSTLSQCTSTTTWCCCWTSLAPISCCDGWNWSARLLGGHRQKNWLTVRLFSRHRSRHTYVRVRKKGNWNCHFHADFEIPLAFIYGLLLFSLASEQFRVFSKKNFPRSILAWLYGTVAQTLTLSNTWVQALTIDSAPPNWSATWLYKQNTSLGSCKNRQFHFFSYIASPTCTVCFYIDLYRIFLHI